MGLFKPTWMGMSKEKALKAVEKLTDQNILTDVAKNAPSSDVRFMAIGKLAEKTITQEYASILAKNGMYRHICKAIIGKLTDQTALSEIALNSKEPKIREAAIEKLTDQANLEEIAKKDNNKHVRLAALNKITDHTILREVMKNEKDKDVRQAIVKIMPDQIDLADVALNDNDVYVRHSAVKKLSDKTVLMNILKNINEDTIVRKAAAEGLTDNPFAQEFLSAIKEKFSTYSYNQPPAINAFMNWYRQNAIERLGQDGIGGGICDDCNCSLKDKTGNVFLRPSGYLCCEKCTIKFLVNADWTEARKNPDRYFGPDLPQKLKQIIMQS